MRADRPRAVLSWERLFRLIKDRAPPGVAASFAWVGCEGRSERDNKDVEGRAKLCSPSTCIWSPRFSSRDNRGTSWVGRIPRLEPSSGRTGPCSLLRVSGPPDLHLGTTEGLRGKRKRCGSNPMSCRQAERCRAKANTMFHSPNFQKLIRFTGFFLSEK